MAVSSSISSSEKRQFFGKLAFALALIIFLDYSAGAFLENRFKAWEGGDEAGRINYFLKQRDPVVIFGSSQALYNYAPSVLEQQLGRGVLNAGMRAQTIICHYGILELVLEQHTPEMIVLDVFYEDVDRLSLEGSLERLSPLVPFGRNPEIAKLLEQRSPFEKYKFLSKVYPYNSLFLPLVKQLFRQDELIRKYKGHAPGTSQGLFKEIELRKKSSAPKTLAVQWDAAPLERFIQRVLEKKIQLVFVQGPVWNWDGVGRSEEERQLLAQYKALVRQYGLPWIEIGPEEYAELKNPALYGDHNHLNRDGAQIFSRILGEELAKIQSRQGQQEADPEKRDGWYAPRTEKKTQPEKSRE